jgi:hypothetical protein
MLLNSTGKNMSSPLESHLPNSGVDGVSVRSSVNKPAQIFAPPQFTPSLIKALFWGALGAFLLFLFICLGLQLLNAYSPEKGTKLTKILLPMQESMVQTVVMPLQEKVYNLSQDAKELRQNQQILEKSVQEKLAALAKPDTTETMQELRTFQAQTQAQLLALEAKIQAIMQQLDQPKPTPDALLNKAVQHLLTRSERIRLLRQDLALLRKVSLTKVDEAVPPPEGLWQTLTSGALSGLITFKRTDMRHVSQLNRLDNLLTEYHFSEAMTVFLQLPALLQQSSSGLRLSADLDKLAAEELLLQTLKP